MYTNDISCSSIKSTGTPGVNIKKSNGDSAVRIFDSGLGHFSFDPKDSGNLGVGGNLTVNGSTTHKPYIGLHVVANATTANVGQVAIADITVAIASSGAYTLLLFLHIRSAPFFL